MDDQLTFDRPTAMKQGADVALNRADADQLMPDEVRVVRRGHVVLRDWSCHILVDWQTVFREGSVLLAEEEASEVIQSHVTVR